MFLVTMDAVAKYLTVSFPVIFLVWSRYVVLLLLILLFMYPVSGKRLFITELPYLHLIRAFCLVTTSTLGMYGLHILPLAETAGLAYICPLVTILLAKVFLGERVGFVRWCCMGGGIIGVIVLTHPKGSISFEGAAYVILAAISFSFYQVMTRKMAATETGSSLFFYPVAVSALFLSFVAPFFFPSHIGASAPDLLDIALIFSLGVLGGVGHYLINCAFINASVSALAPFMYCQLLWAVILGWQFFGQIPDENGFIGILIIFASGLVAAISLKNRGNA